MIPLKVMHDQVSGEDVIEVPLRGQMLLEVPMLNKGSAFTEEERHDLGLLGLLPSHVSSPEEQLERTYHNYNGKSSDIEKYVFLASLQDRNETLYYKLLSEHVAEMLPIVYTPTVGLACQEYSHLYRRPRGLYLAYPYRDQLVRLLQNKPYPEVRVIVVTDGERILGLGDLGVGGLGISIGKLALYSLCAGIHPASTLPIVLDVGTDNRKLLEDPLYLGWRHERIRGKEYDSFVEAFVDAVKTVFPNALLQWEDFSKNNARRLLDRYRDDLCTFNDDIQGTGAVTLAGLLAAVEATGTKLSDQRIVSLGAGSAATGVCDQAVAAMLQEGCPEREALASVWMVDSRGLVLESRTDLEPAKRRYARSDAEISAWMRSGAALPTLEDVVRNVRPTVLIGTAAMPGAFHEGLVREMARHCPCPIIFPLSNPTSKCEAKPADLLAWTAGKALIATGSPFADVEIEGRRVAVGQCNNVFIFPGVGLGVIASGARRVTDSMFLAAARALSNWAPIRKDPNAALYPSVNQARKVSREVAIAVAEQALKEGLAETVAFSEIVMRVEAAMWTPRYARIKYHAPVGAPYPGV